MTADDRPARYAYLGPRGTFTEAALLTLPEAAEAEPSPTRPSRPSWTRCAAERSTPPWWRWRTPSRGPSDHAGRAGHRRAAPDRRRDPLPVSFALLVRPGTTLDDIKTVASHPIAQPQCRRWLLENVPHAEWRAATSNAEAAQHVADGALRRRARRLVRRGPLRADRPRRRHPRRRRRRHPLRRPEPPCARPRRPARTRRPSSRSSARTTRAPCWRSSTSSPCAASTSP